jgi:hypothetical protein
MNIFPSKMMEGINSPLSLDVIKAKLNFFELQLHELHWQTHGLGEHLVLGDAYNKIFELKDEIVEKIMGYTGVRTQSMPVEPIKNYIPGLLDQILTDVISFAKQLESFGLLNSMPDIENIAQSLSGDFAQYRYRLTLS